MTRARPEAEGNPRGGLQTEKTLYVNVNRESVLFVCSFTKKTGSLFNFTDYFVLCIRYRNSIG